MTDYEKSLTLVRSTGLGYIARSPAHFKTWVESPEETKTCFEFGKAFHCALLEPETFDRRYIMRPDFGDLRYKDNKAEYAAWKAEAGDRQEIECDDFAAIDGMIRAVHAHSRARRLVVGGYAEQCITVERGHLTQIAKPDYVLPTKSILVDAKSTEDARPKAVEKSVGNWGYLMQAAHYLAVAREHGMDDPRFVFLFVEKAAPHGIYCGDLDPDDLTWAETKRQELMDLQERCVESGIWPCYDEAIQRIKLPVWARG